MLMQGPNLNGNVLTVMFGMPNLTMSKTVVGVKYARPKEVR
jgi:hypothetical protein